MLEGILHSLHMYLLTLVMTPFGLVAIPRGIGILIQDTQLALIVYGYLIAYPLLYGYILKRKKKRAGLGTAVMWTSGAHFALFELVCSWQMGMSPDSISPSMEAVGLSTIMLFAIAGSTGYLTYKQSLKGKENRAFSRFTLFRE